MKRDYYSASIAEFRNTVPDQILGHLAANNPFTLEQTQRNAWLEEIDVLQDILLYREGFICFEYAIPRMGKRIDVVLIIGPVIFVLEFKVGEKEFTTAGLDQVCDYALDLKNFHETSYSRFIVPILIATNARTIAHAICATPQNDKLLCPVRCNTDSLGQVIDSVLAFAAGDPNIDPIEWQRSRYCPTPTIIEAALALYKGHSVSDISRNDATALNLTVTAEAISKIVRESKEGGFKSICFVTGVPGAGKTFGWAQHCHEAS